MIVIISSEPGYGKTWQAMAWEEPVLYIDTENPRAEKTQKKWYANQLVTVVPVLVRTDHVRNYYSSYLELKKQLDAIRSMKSLDFSTLVIDGISDIRGKYAKAKWFHDHPKRVNPLSEEWTEINKTTNEMLEPLIDMANDCGFHLVMTAQFCDLYGRVEKMVDGKVKIMSEKLGREPLVEDWQTYGVDTLITLTYQKPHYIAVCDKSLVGCWDENITGKSLYGVLKGKGI